MKVGKKLFIDELTSSNGELFPYREDGIVLTTCNVSLLVMNTWRHCCFPFRNVAIY